jgi:hypothetical protein
MNLFYLIMKKKHYSKPDITKISLDYTISILMMSQAPGNNDPVKRTFDNKKSTSNPFASPFADRPFN